MKILKSINTNFAIWSMLNGDHALVENVKKLDKELVEKPDFSSKLENSLRKEVFLSKRKWIHDYMKDASLCVAEITFDELLKFESCYSDIKFEQFLDSYQLSTEQSKEFTIVRKTKDDVQKGIEAIDDIKKRVESLKIDLKKQKNKAVPAWKICSEKYLNSENLWIATNRGLMVKKKDSSTIKVIDGTHRLLSYGLLVRLEKLNVQKIKCIFWEEV